MPLQKICKDKRYLVNVYSSSVTRYYEAVNALVSHDSIEDRDKFEELYRAAEGCANSFRQSSPKASRAPRGTWLLIASATQD